MTSAVIDVVADLPATQRKTGGSSEASSEFYASGQDDLSRVRTVVSKATATVYRVRQGEVFEPANPRASDEEAFASELPTVSAPKNNFVIAGLDTRPLQVWEGEVLSVDPKADQLRAKLVSKLRDVPDHVGTINITENVMEQDRDLVRPGAVFYLILYREVKRGGTVINSQELRFRRFPNWSRTQLQAIREEAKRLATELGL